MEKPCKGGEKLNLHNMGKNERIYIERTGEKEEKIYTNKKESKVFVGDKGSKTRIERKICRIKHIYT